MVQKLASVWESLRTSLWFLPSLIVGGAVALALGMIELDGFSSREQLMERWPRLFGAGAEGSRGLLSAIAGSMITVAGVTFSITVVALALASSQYTSRILANFMRDRANQAVLGVFVGVFAYSLVVLRTIRGGEDGLFVPALAVLVALVLALVAIGFLIFFIHHIAASIQANSIIETTARETRRAIDRLFPSGVGVSAAAPLDEQPSDGAPREWAQIPAAKTGYVQRVDGDVLFDIARARGVTLRMDCGIGEFIIEGSRLLSVDGAQPTDDMVDRTNAAFTLGKQRTVTQDAAYGIRQLVDVALKALSPGVNDTTTATTCLDFLGSLLARLIDRRIEAPYRSDGCQLRLITRGPTFDRLLGEAFEQIRQNAESNVAVLVRLLEVLKLLVERTTDGRRQATMLRHVQWITDSAGRGVPAVQDRATIQAAAARVRAAARSPSDLGAA